MTKEYKELIDRLAKGINKKGCSAILISRTDDEDEFMVNNYTADYDLILSTVTLINFALKELPAFGQNVLCANLKDIVIKHEERRFQKGI